MLSKSFEIDQNTAAQLRRACGLPDYDENGKYTVPPDVEAAYRHFITPFNMIGGTIPRADTLALIVMIARVTAGQKPPEIGGREISVVEAWNADLLKQGGEIEVNFRGVWHAAQILGVGQKGREVTAYILSTGEQKKLSHEKTRMPTELTDVVRPEPEIAGRK